MKDDVHIAIMAPNPRWSIYLIFDDLRRYLERDGYYVDLYRSSTFQEPLKQYDRVISHFQDYPGFESDLFQDHLRQKTWVWASGFNYTKVPWDCVDNVISQSQQQADRLPVDSYVCPAGVDTDIFYPVDVKQHGVGAVGNLNHGKWDRILYNDLRDEYEVRFHDGWGDDFVVRPKLKEVYSSFECYVHLSSYEGGGLPIIEAGACGVPVVSTPVGYAPEVDGVHTVGEAKESPREELDIGVDEVSEAVESAISDGPIVDEIRRDWSWDVLIDDWIDCLDI